MFDPSSKWMLEEHGRSILWLAGTRSVLSCRARQPEVVQPRQLPDGLLEVRLAGHKKAHLVLVEVATYPETRVVAQMSDNLRLVRQFRGTLVDGVVLCLCPRGTYRIPQQVKERSPLGWTEESITWKVVELWTLSAEELLTAPDVALALWATLARYDGPPEILLQRCRDRIDSGGGEQRANLLAVAQVFARIHFDKPEWLDILGGTRAMIESPLIQEIVQESQRTARFQSVVDVLESRFNTVPESISAGLQQVKELEALSRLIRFGSTCASLEVFEKALHDELPRPPAASTRGRRGKKS